MIGVILAGGENSRMPAQKAFLTVNGKTIIENSLGVLRKIFNKIIISTNTPERYFFTGSPMVGDIVQGKGPAAGILSVLAATAADSAFVVACDMPRINEGLIRYMADRYKEAAKSTSCRQIDAVIPVFEGRIEPLFGIYANTSEIIKTMSSAIDSGRPGLTGLLKFLNVLYIQDSEIRALDRHGESFININTEEDYAKIGGEACLA